VQVWQVWQNLLLVQLGKFCKGRLDHFMGKDVFLLYKKQPSFAKIVKLAKLALCTCTKT